MIRILPPDVANKIAAGEVVERPASVVKELVENSLDAGATRVLIEIEEGGKRLIRVTDDGDGMGREDLELAFTAHATSKIASVDELFRIVTYGFRGEALASIGSVSRTTITTRRRNEDLGHRLVCEGGALGQPHDAGGPEGTVIEVRDLFYNVPARRKFLKADGPEVARISEVLTRMALARPDLHIELRHHDRKVLHCENSSDLEARITGLFGRELAGKLLPISDRSEGLSVGGYIGLPEVARPSASRQYIVVNDRFVKDKSLQAAVARGFEGFLMPRRFPVFFLRIDIDPAAIDVNVHPMKTELRFREKNRVFAGVQRACRAALGSSAPAGRLVLSPDRSYEAVAETPRDPALPQTRRERVAEMEASLYEGSLQGTTRTETPTPARPGPGPGRPPAGKGRGCRPRLETASICESEPRFIQVHGSYILVEDADGFHVVDQHALHERMIYERLLDRVDRGERGSQRLLVPAVAELSPMEKLKIMARVEDLERLGLEIEDFGGAAVAILAVPLELGKIGYEALLRAVLDAVDEDLAEGFRTMHQRVIATMACRSAVTFNERLSDERIRDLLAWQRANPSKAACPHGRPTRVRIGLDELERQFLRKD
ncbi:MAG: DNA mismatch repair endonuclease MutL [Planctomycetes bacterium]|nr:DNA mismatch repair endonuclease MutL [Planctomycetota bacterium]